MKKYSAEIANTIKNFLKNDGWHFSFDEDEGIFKFGLSINSRIKHLTYLIRVRDDNYTVYSFPPVGVDKGDHEMMVKMAEFVCRVNYGLRSGNFELDVRNGKIRCKVYVDCGGGVIPTKEMIEESIYCPIYIFDQYGSGIMEILSGNATAEEAITKCEIAELQKLLGIVVPEGDRDAQSMLERLIALGITEDEMAVLSEISPQKISGVCGAGREEKRKRKIN